MSQNFINFQLYLSDFSVSLKNWPSRYILAFERLVHSLDSQINLFGSIEIMYEFCDSNFEYNDVLLWDMAFLAIVAAFLSYTIHSFSNCYSMFHVQMYCRMKQSLILYLMQKQYTFCMIYQNTCTFSTMKISTFLQKKNHQFIGLFTFRMHNSKLMDLKNVTRGHFGAKMAKKQTKFLTSQQAVRTQGTYRCLGVNQNLQDLLEFKKSLKIGIF